MEHSQIQSAVDAFEQQRDSQLFKLSFRPDDIAVITFNVLEKPVNWLGQKLIQQLDAALDHILHWQAKGVLFQSGKQHHFVQGFPLSELENCGEHDLINFANHCQQLMDKIANLSIPTVCVIEGNCFGLGLELALACDYRIVGSTQPIFLAMPQVRSGILPFAGGCLRLPQQIGLARALYLLLNGEKCSAERALEIGLVDEVVNPAILTATACYYLQYPQQTAKVRFQLWRKIERIGLMRQRILNQAEQQCKTWAFENYPAINALLALFRQQQEHHQHAVSAQFARLFLDNSSKMLRQIERTHRRMRHQYLDLQHNVALNKVAVLGSGFMGAGIAYITAARAHLPVRIRDINPHGVQKALRLSYLLLQKEVEQGFLPYGKLLQKMYLISGGDRFVGKPQADIVIEAVYEDLQLKQQLIAESEAYYAPDTVFASNTNTLSITEIAQSAVRPENVIGIHYFTPVSQRRVVEIIPHAKCAPQTIAKAVGLVIQQGQAPLLVKDSTGFFITRILSAFLLEAYYVLLDGEDIPTIEKALQEFGFKVGPFAMLDEMGLDIFVKALPQLERSFGTRFALPPKIDDLLRNERKGRKNRRGFYLYHSRTGDRTQVDKSIYQVLDLIIENNLESEAIVRRCILMMINEAAYCAQESVIASLEEGNVASVLGFFFPEFRGGIYAYIDTVGADTIVAELTLLRETLGERFTPCAWLQEKALSQPEVGEQ
ncbi:3-hydroxyacyl-CoA dehydrogenase NAD-binding domain-containing protein [Spirabiliibacterium falconis]|uniref:3-hydroxyacyl-CoA dehydrogenase NAD-binding domain-containing protein n=1 Tax=Spirabiliibacterium falconis TaxID=572023 RepID=UPI001AADA667|nr:3-hydroxyacyl-CoA dehydrogenase NAD-binding domain-containing protein [Spirabiliibacterium falconis]MBE2894312.1 fatty-acid oxidation protein subunit alpha [Spirabiliibacterium falconis]